ncbi:MAG TPA: hypothetical protein VFR58_17525 [Flavisolibacter sp.]|nr:hypothetical protein [Flavisolibacter sp.]
MINEAHKGRFDEMKKKLTLAGYRESAFTTVELLFYEAITISRTYGNDPGENPLLAALKEVEANQYRNTKEHFKKPSQREQAIRKFVVQFKNILTKSAKDTLPATGN